VAVAESAPQANRRSVCVIRTTAEQHFSTIDTERRAGLSAMAELLVLSYLSVFGAPVGVFLVELHLDLWH